MLLQEKQGLLTVNMWRGAVMVKVCHVCGKEFEGRNCSKCCSAECQDELYKRTQKEYRRKRTIRERTGNPAGRPRKPKSERPKDQIQPRQKNTLCWSCQNATGGCSWSRALKPVKGWKAEPLRIQQSSLYRERSYTDSYLVKKCPKYIKDE